MKKTEHLTKIMLAVLVMFALTAVILQVLNNKTSLIETLYEIIAFAFAAVALLFAIVQGIYNTRISNELHKIAREINDVLKAEKSNTQLSHELMNRIEKHVEK